MHQSRCHFPACSLPYQRLLKASFCRALWPEYAAHVCRAKLSLAALAVHCRYHCPGERLIQLEYHVAPPMPPAEAIWKLAGLAVFCFSS